MPFSGQIRRDARVPDRQPKSAYDGFWMVVRRLSNQRGLQGICSAGGRFRFSAPPSNWRLSGV